MKKTEPTIARQIAAAAGTVQLRWTGRIPSRVTVVLSGDTLVITLHDALTPAEQAMAPWGLAGAARLQ